jgi:predicted nucleotidyltransferase
MNMIKTQQALSTMSISMQIRSVLEMAPDVAVGLLFGSATKNRLRFDSDIDIAIAGEQAFSLHRLKELAYSLSEAVKRPVDLIDLVSTKGLICHQALTKGIPLIVKNKRIMAQLMYEYVCFCEDFLPAITVMLAQRGERFVNG